MTDIDVLIIGGGIAAVMAALKAKKSGVRNVVMVDKGNTGSSGMSSFAAGFLFVYFPKEDDLDRQFRRMVRGLGWLAQQDAIMEHFQRVYGILEDMEKYGVEFEKNPDGSWKRSVGRGKDPGMHFPGSQLMTAMAKAARRHGVEQITRTAITDLLVRDGNVYGAVGFDVRTGEFRVFKSRATVIATGGCWYKGRCPGQRDVTGDGAAMGFRAGALLSGAEWGEPSNMFPSHYDIGPGMNVYVGEGGKFFNNKGERFMERYNPELGDRSALRLLVAALCVEVKRGNGPIVLDMTHLTPEQLNRMRWILPLPMMMFERAGLVVNNRFVRPIEWVPAAPIARTGFVVDKNHATNLIGLYASGEAVSRQARIEGITSCATSGAIAGESAADFAKRTADITLDNSEVMRLKERAFAPLNRKEGVEPNQAIISIQEAIFPYDVLFLRHEKRMQKALERIKDIQDSQIPRLLAYDPHYLMVANEVCNMGTIAELQLRSALMRKETRTVLREDYPYEDNIDWLKWIDIRNENGEAVLSTRDIPFDRYPLKPPREKKLYYIWSRAQEMGSIKVENGEVIWV